MNWKPFSFFKYDPKEDGLKTFNIVEALNKNWDAIINRDEELRKGIEDAAGGGSAAETSFDNANAQLPDDPENVQEALDSAGKELKRTAEQISTRTAELTDKLQIYISRKDGDKYRMEAHEFLPAKAKPVSDFSVALQSGGIDAYTKLMLHMDGENGSTIITDSSANPKTVTVVGDAKISDAQSKFGGASCLFDGNFDQLTVPQHADFNLGTSDFTVDFWVRPIAFSVANEHLFSFGGKRSVYKGAYEMAINPNGAVIVAATTGTGVGTDIYNKTSITKITTDAWWHIAGVRHNTAFKLFINGIEETAITQTIATAIRDMPDVFQIGYCTAQDAPNSFNGHIEEFRFSKGIARWISNFTPPERAYGNKDGLSITWQNPEDAFFAQQTMIRRSDIDYPVTVEDGILIYEGDAEEFLDTDADTSVKQNYSAFGVNEIAASHPVHAEYDSAPGYLMLYDAGDECVEATGGWEAWIGQSSPGCVATKNGNDIYLYSTRPSGLGGNANANTIYGVDLTNYETCYIALKETSYSGNGKIRCGEFIEKDIYSLGFLNATTVTPANGILKHDLRGVGGTYKLGIHAMVSPAPGLSVLKMTHSFLLSQDDWQTWLTRAGLDPASYADLDTVLSTAATMDILANSTSAVQYMISCSGTIMGGVLGTDTAFSAMTAAAKQKMASNPHWAKFAAIYGRAL